MKGLPINTNVTLTEKEYKKIAEFVYNRCGIDLKDNKQQLVKARLMKRLRFLKLKSFSEYYDFVVADGSGEELVELINAMSTNVTHFFREDQHFNLLKSKVLADIISCKSTGSKKELRIWCSAAATGQEVYSILMTVGETLKSDFFNWDVKLLATDISTKALSHAYSGVYTKESMKSVPGLLREKYFDCVLNNRTKSYRVKKIYRDMITFRRLNLISPKFPFKHKFDIIFCRNVMIYFDKKTQEQLVQKFLLHMQAGGYLFIGHSESLIGTDVKVVRVAPAVFKKGAS